MKKKSYFFGSENFEEQYYPSDNFYTPTNVEQQGLDLDRQDSPANSQRDGKNFKEFAQFNRMHKRLKRLSKIKKILKSMKNKKNVALQPASFYDNLYGYVGDSDKGTFSFPLEYYGDAGAYTTNPYNNIYQLASSRIEKIQIRSMIFNDLFKIASNK